MVEDKEKFGALGALVAFIITLIPLIIGFSMTGRSISIPSIGDAANVVIGWILVVAGLVGVYAFLTKKK